MPLCCIFCEKSLGKFQPYPILSITLWSPAKPRARFDTPPGQYQSEYLPCMCTCGWTDGGFCMAHILLAEYLVMRCNFCIARFCDCITNLFFVRVLFICLVDICWISRFFSLACMPKRHRHLCVFFAPLFFPSHYHASYHPDFVRVDCQFFFCVFFTGFWGWNPVNICVEILASSSHPQKCPPDLFFTYLFFLLSFLLSMHSLHFLPMLSSHGVLLQVFCPTERFPTHENGVSILHFGGLQ